ncbi:MAG TPA: Fe-S cluster assembly scaffold protein NifU [Oscillospiraceae bacterium]|nr:Fe-S cluster assembly scaffold protein NifU [Oscillospiraceae bacterium]
MLYSEKVMEHFLNPQNVGVIEDADGIGETGNVKCGDIMKIYLKVKDDVIEDIKFETFGCASAIASSSMATQLVKGKTIAETLELTNKAVVEALDGLPPQKVHCSVLAEEAIRAAIADYYRKSGKTPADNLNEPDCAACTLCDSCREDGTNDNP